MNACHFCAFKVLLILQNPSQTVPSLWLSTDNSRPIQLPHFAVTLASLWWLCKSYLLGSFWKFLRGRYICECYWHSGWRMQGSPIEAWHSTEKLWDTGAYRGQCEEEGVSDGVEKKKIGGGSRYSSLKKTVKNSQSIITCSMLQNLASTLVSFWGCLSIQDGK